MLSLTLLCLSVFIVAGRCTTCSVLRSVYFTVETSGSFCHNSGVLSNIQVATFCRPSYATGSSVIVDGYVAFESAIDTSCLCTASITIPGGATSTVAFSAFFGIQPGYAGCGSYINLKHLDDNIIMACSLFESVTTRHNDTIEIQLVKETKPMDTRYCMKLQMSDSSATVSVTCNGGVLIKKTTTSPITSLPATTLPAHKEQTTTVTVITSKLTTMPGESSIITPSENPQSSKQADFSSTLPTVKKPPDSQESDNIPVEIFAPVASVAGILLVCLICIVVCIRIRSSIETRSQRSTQQSTYDNLQDERDTNASTYSSISTTAVDYQHYESVD